MNSPFYALMALVLAAGATSCQDYSSTTYDAAGYSSSDSYNRGFSDGSSDKLAGRAHKPHIQEDPNLPSAYRHEYMWGYNEGYKNPYAQNSGRGSK